MLEFIFRWEVVGIIVGILATIGIGVLALGDFRIAKVCFAIASADLAGGVVMWGASTQLSLKMRALIVGISFASIGILLVESLRYIDRKRAVTSAKLDKDTQKKPRTESKSPPFPELLFSAELQPDTGISVVLINPCDEPIDDVAIAILKSPTPKELDSLNDTQTFREAIAARTQQFNPGILRPQLATPIGNLAAKIMPEIGVPTHYQISIYTRHEAFVQYTSLTLHPNGFVQQRSQLSSNKTKETLWKTPDPISAPDRTQRKEAVLKNARDAREFLQEQQKRLQAYRGKSRERHRLEEQIVKQFVQSYGYRTNWALNEITEQGVNVEQEMRWLSNCHSVAALLKLIERINELGSKLP